MSVYNIKFMLRGVASVEAENRDAACRRIRDGGTNGVPVEVMQFEVEQIEKESAE